MSAPKLWSVTLKGQYSNLFHFIDLCSKQKGYNFITRSLSSKLGGKTPERSWTVMRLGLLSIGVGTLAGAGYSYKKLQQARAPVINKDFGAQGPLLVTLPQVAVSRQVISPTDHTGLQLVLFQYPTCPFCCKVRAFLDYYGFSYDVVEVNPVLRQQIRWSSYKKVPIVVAKVEGGYQQLNDSSLIVSSLASYLHDPMGGLPNVLKCYPTINFNDDDGSLRSEIMNRYFLMFQGDIPTGRTKENIIEERKWRKWADDRLVHVLSPNVYRTKEEALQAFHWFSEVGEWDKHFSPWERSLVIYVGACAMWLIGKRLKKRHNLKDDVRVSLYDECNNWLKTLRKQGTSFLGGQFPNLADLAVFGVLNSIEGCSAFQDLLDNTRIGTWYQLMKDQCQGHAGTALMGL
uniref:(California timema) hypothetical protein n=1 Tax=Timema californicum TaxID=61474 RepID=A0A7R9J9X0_TIMCA|nr:unnamed protein product [Timema californicum]